MSDEKNELDMELHNLAKQYKDDRVNLEKAIKELAEKTSLDTTIDFMKKTSESADLLVDTTDPAKVSDALTPVLLPETPSEKQIEAPPPAQSTEEENAHLVEMEEIRKAAEKEAERVNSRGGGKRRKRKTKKKKKSKKRKTKRRYKTGKRN